MIYNGFWGFYVACNIPIFDVGEVAGMDGSFFTTTNIYLTPTTTSAITFNFLMSLSGGLMMGYIISKGDAFWTYSSGLAGVIAASSGNDLYHPIQSMIIAAIGVVFMYKMHFWVERKFKIDDAVGAVAVHGYVGMQPSVSANDNKLGELIVLIVRGETPEFIARFQHMVRKTYDPADRFASAQRFFYEAYYQRPTELAGELTALCSVDLQIASRILEAEQCELHFEQFSQSYAYRAT